MISKCWLQKGKNEIQVFEFKKEREKGMRKTPRIDVFLYTAICLILLSPPLYESLIMRLGVLLAMGIWVVLQVYNQHMHISRFGVFVIVYILTSCVRSYLAIGSFMNPRITRIYYYCFFAISQRTVSETQFERYKKVPWSILTVMPIWLLISIGMGMQTPFLFRGLSGSGLLDNHYYSSRGVVGYDYIYAVVICIPVFVALVFSSTFRYRSTRQKLLLIVSLFLNLVLLWIANYGLAIFSLTIGMFIYLMVGKDRKSSVITYLLSFACISGLVYAYLNIGAVISNFGKLFGNSYYAEKIVGLTNTLADGTTYGRIEIYTDALASIFVSPLFGIGFVRGVNTHSEILYALVYYGIPIGCAEMIVFFAPFYGKNFRKMVPKRVLFSTLAIFIIVTLFDPSGVALGPMMFSVYRLLLIDENMHRNVERRIYD